MNYFRKATTISPAVIMDSKTKTALISGNSLCNDIRAYANVVEDIKQQLEKFAFTDLNIKLKVFNARAAKSLIELLKAVKDGKSRAQTTIHWYYEPGDSEMKAMGKDYGKLLGMKFEISSN